MPDYITDYSSLDSLLGYGAGERKAPAQPTMPLPGVGAPISDQQSYDAVAAYAPQQPNMFAGPQRPNTPVAIPRILPPSQTVAPTPRSVPMGNSNDQLDTLRESLKRVESSGNYQAKNSTTSASGAYQYTNGTWGGYGGYREARLAPKNVQDARANEDLIKSLRKFNGDPFAVIANHMLPVQAKQPWLWMQPSYLKQGNRTIQIPPVIDYVRKVVKGTPYENQLEEYMAAYLPRQRG